MICMVLLGRWVIPVVDEISVIPINKLISRYVPGELSIFKKPIVCCLI